MSSTLLDEDLLILEALDEAVPCVYGEDHPADMWIICRNCSNAISQCVLHWRDEVMRFIAAKDIGPLMVVVCRACGAESDSIDEGFRVIPVRP